ncbi:MAG: fibronectin type III domain-containing protein [Minicystis sp.]
MSTSTAFTAIVVVLRAPRQHKPLITYAKAVLEHMLNNPAFPSPSPTLDVFAADIAALEDAETKAASRARGAAKARNARAARVRSDLAHLRDYVQRVAEEQTNPADVAAVVASAFMGIKQPAKRTRPALDVRNTGVSGCVAISARTVSLVATYYWQYSLDQQTWTDVPETMRARTTISGLTSARTYYFRFRALTRTGEIGFSQVVSLLVH